MAAKKKPSKAYEFAIARLKRNPKLDYATLKAAAAKERIKLFPVVYGRAQAILGIVPIAKRGQGRVAKAKAKRAAGGRGPGRPRKAPALTSLEGVAEQIEILQREHRAATDALNKIRKILDSI